MPKKSILITGGSGFIGSHVADALLDEGYRVVIIDNLSTGVRANIPPEAEFHNLDIRDSKVGDLFAANNFDAVIHHAGQINLRYSMREPASDVEVNVVGSLKILEWCRHYNVKKFIFASTGGAIYGEQEYFPADEKHPARPISIYGADKLAVEQYLYVMHVDYGLSAVCLRYANVYGPRQNPLGEAGVIAIFTNRMLEGEPSIINGDGLQTRDYTYVGDVARINSIALDLSGFHILNVGTSIETDVVTIYDKLNALTGANQARIFGSAQPGEQLRSCIDSSKAQACLNWHPEIGLDEGLERTVEWFKMENSKEK
jgi:UDP-glucose 4-epimerase